MSFTGLLVWTMKKRKPHDTSAPVGIGVLIFLFFLMAINFLKGSNNLFCPERSPSGGHVFAQISGDVRYPGVYGFDNPASLRELVDRADGSALAEHAVQLPAGLLCQSGDHIELKNRQKKIFFHIGKMSAFYRTTLGIPVSVNSDSAEGLASVPGIGFRTAEAIVQERIKRGRFEKLSDIISVRGIGPALYRKIKPYLALD